ncbi:dystrobrevin beta isoform X1 [Achroia grisella]|uniref:dystrobrevin beta isoform X1 n=1 Tax=Achroia grisella TaxID=688607 RepID=UPI0027D2DCFF|nr:dystrobrevin beta isoform X1 [Achroia grisella]
MSLERDNMSVGPSMSVGGSSNDPRSQLLQEMREHNFDMIRFASYRTACKLRYVQKKCNLHVIDIWNVIEAFRENALNTLEPNACVNVTRLETLVSSLYHNLNKRLPPAHQVSVEACSALLLNWLLSAYSTGENVGKIRVFSIKVALATMCAGKLMDKLRYIFSQLSDGNGHLLMKRLSDYLREVLALPAAVYESPSFAYNDSLALSIFNQQSGKITVNDFLDTLMSDPGPPCLVWLPLLHRLASVENVVHPLACSACRRGSLTGFRYRCTRCANYTLCQDCFWRGRVCPPHTNDHEVKEYAAYKSPSKQIGATLRKSFRCVPERARPLPRYPDRPERTLDLSHIVPPSPVPAHNGFPEYCGGGAGPHTGSLDSRWVRARGHDLRGTDDEHRLIARYAARLAHENRTMPRAGRSASLTPELGRSSSEGSEVDAARQQRELISQLEAKNREIMREIARLRRQQEAEASAGASATSGNSAPPLVSELRALRQRKDELEGHLSSLQESRKHLMQQLEGLMRMLKTQQSSPRSTPNSSPRSTKSPPLPGAQPQPSAPEREPTSRGTVRSAPQTPSLGERERIDMTHSLGGMESMGGDGRTYHQNQRPTTMGIDNRSLRSDLLYAADSVTNAMSTLVRELNSEGSDTEDTIKGESRKQRSDYEDDDSDEPMPRPQPPRHYLHDNNVQDTPPPLPARTGLCYPRT